MTTSKFTGKRGHSRTNILRVDAGKILTNGKNNICSRRIAFLPESEGLPDNSFNTISPHRTTNLPMNTYPEPACPCRIWPANQRKPLTVQTTSHAVNFLKLPTFPQQGAFQKSKLSQGYAESLLRPLALRALMTARPARVLILSRNPWVRLRFKLLG